MIAVFVVFTSTVEVRISTSAVYMGDVPVAEHDSWLPGTARTAGSSAVILGGPSVTIKINWS